MNEFSINANVWSRRRSHELGSRQQAKCENAMPMSVSLMFMCYEYNVTLFADCNKRASVDGFSEIPPRL